MFGITLDRELEIRLARQCSKSKWSDFLPEPGFIDGYICGVTREKGISRWLFYPETFHIMSYRLNIKNLNDMLHDVAFIANLPIIVVDNYVRKGCKTECLKIWKRVSGICMFVL